MKNPIKSLPIKDIAGYTVGGTIARIGIKKLKASSNETMKKFAAPIVLVAGVLALKMKNPIVKAAGAGMIALGGSEVIAGFMPTTVPAISGYSDYDLNGLYDSVEGVEDVLSGPDGQVLNGTDTDDINGSDEDNDY